MYYKDYEFNIGDTVITTQGEIGKIVGFCSCNKCAERGYFEPMWLKFDGEHVEYISNYEAEFGFSQFYQIGKYRFNDLETDNVKKQISELEEQLDHLKKQLDIIEQTENQRHERTNPLKKDPFTLSEPNWAVPNCCKHCNNHPINGGSGICNCTLPYFEQSRTIIY